MYATWFVKPANVPVEVLVVVPIDNLVFGRVAPRPRFPFIKFGAAPAANTFQALSLFWFKFKKVAKVVFPESCAAAIPYALEQ